MAFSTLDIVLALGLGLLLIVAFKMFASSPATAVKKPASMTDKKASGTTDAASTDRPKVLFLFGSQSGTAENYSYDLAEEGKTLGFDASVVDLEDFEPSSLLDHNFTVFLVATHGEGEPTDNAEKFWEYITDDARDPSDMSHLTFAVFALGNRQYRHFCSVGKRIDTEMAAMNGERLLPVGLGDDDGTLEEDFDTWRSAFWQSARLKFLKSSSSDETAPSAFNPTIDVAFVPTDSESSKSYRGGIDKAARFFNDPIKDHKTDILPVSSVQELRPNPSGLESTVHMDLSLANSKLVYRTADNLGIHPRNDYKLAGRLAKRLGVNMNAIFTSKTKGSRKLPFPSPCSVEDAFVWYLDINSCPRGKFPAIFAAYTNNEREKNRLLYYTNDPQGKEEFAGLHYNWLEMLEAFPGVTIPFSHIIEMVPRLHHRFYTISSSSKVSPKTIGVTVTRLFKENAPDRMHLGTCSNYVCEATESKTDKVIAYVRPSTFRLPVRGGIPIIMVGPGTGIAPFRAFIQEFRTRTGEHKYGETVLYFGCRTSTSDYIYRDELESALADGTLNQLHLAFSRESAEKVYVQDLLKNNGEQTWKLIEQGAHIYVCGATLMGRDILSTVRSICVQYGGKTEAEAEIFVDKMIRANKYVQELWSA